MNGSGRYVFNDDGTVEKEFDPVERPAHYNLGSIECIDAIEPAICAYKTPTYAYLAGQVLKYIWRWPHKNGIEDLQKAKWYLDRLIEKEEERIRDELTEF